MTAQMPRDEPLRPSDVEAEYRISNSTLSSWRAHDIEHPESPVGPPWFRMGPRRVVYMRSAVEEWIDQQRTRKSA